MQLRDPTLLISIIGLPGRKLTQSLNQQLDTYSVATSNEGLLNIRKYWDSHCTTLAKLPAIALLDTSSYPKGLSDLDFLQLLGRITDLQEWQIWDLWDTLDIHSCGYVSVSWLDRDVADDVHISSFGPATACTCGKLIGCSEFTLVIVLMCAGLSQQQMAAVHTFHGSICRVFAGAHVFSPVAGILQCCLLMSLPTSCLIAAVRHLNIKLQHILACSNSNAAACGSMGDNSRYRDMKAAVKRELHAPEVSSGTAGVCTGRNGKDSSKDSSNQSSSPHVAAGAKTLSGSSNRVLPEVAGDSQDRAGPTADPLARLDSRGATAALHQGVQLLLYIAIRLAQGDIAVMHGGVEASRIPDVGGSKQMAGRSSSTVDTQGAWQSRCLCCVIS